jgi:sugar-specific transcriptional regulator TrmB
MILSQALTQFGLNDKQAKVYLACLELGPASILEIAKKSGINRATAYYIIEELIAKSLLTQTALKKRKLFAAAEPADIMNLIKEKEELLKSILPDLNALNNLSIKKPKIRFYEGDEGIYKVVKDYLTAHKEALKFANHEQFDLALKYDPELVSKRIKHNIFLRMIVPDLPKSWEWQKKDKSQLRKTKIVSNKKYPFQTEVTIYNNKIALTSYKEKIGVIIESKPIAETLKMVFNLCWDNIK